MSELSIGWCLLASRNKVLLPRCVRTSHCRSPRGVSFIALREDALDRNLVDISPLAEIARPFRELARVVARVERPAPRRHRRGRDVEEAERDRAVHGVRYTNFTLRGCQ